MSEKAEASREVTQRLYEQALIAEDTVNNELEPQLKRVQGNIKDVEGKTRVTKDAVEAITKSISAIDDFPDILKDTVAQATDAETLAHDALASIDARANEITKNKDRATELQVNHAELKFALDATAKALADIDQKRRQRRDTDSNVDDRIEELKRKEIELDNLQDSILGMLGTLKGRLGSVRRTLGG